MSIHVETTKSLQNSNENLMIHFHSELLPGDLILFYILPHQNDNYNCEDYLSATAVTIRSMNLQLGRIHPFIPRDVPQFRKSVM